MWRNRSNKGSVSRSAPQERRVEAKSAPVKKDFNIDDFGDMDSDDDDLRGQDRYSPVPYGFLRDDDGVKEDQNIYSPFKSKYSSQSSAPPRNKNDKGLPVRPALNPWDSSTTSKTAINQPRSNTSSPLFNESVAEQKLKGFNERSFIGSQRSSTFNPKNEARASFSASHSSGQTSARRGLLGDGPSPFSSTNRASHALSRPSSSIQSNPQKSESLSNLFPSRPLLNHNQALPQQAANIGATDIQLMQAQLLAASHLLGIDHLPARTESLGLPNAGLMPSSSSQGFGSSSQSQSSNFALINTGGPQPISNQPRPPVPDGTGSHRYPSPDLSSLTFDSAAGLKFDHTTGLHYEANSGYFFNGNLKIFLRWDAFTQTYLRVENAAGLQIPQAFHSNANSVSSLNTPPKADLTPLQIMQSTQSSGYLGSDLRSQPSLPVSFQNIQQYQMPGLSNLPNPLAFPSINAGLNSASPLPSGLQNIGVHALRGSQEISVAGHQHPQLPFEIKAGFQNFSQPPGFVQGGGVSSHRTLALPDSPIFSQLPRPTGHNQAREKPSVVQPSFVRQLTQVPILSSDEMATVKTVPSKAVTKPAHGPVPLLGLVFQHQLASKENLKQQAASKVLDLHDILKRRMEQRSAADTKKQKVDVTEHDAKGSGPASFRGHGPVRRLSRSPTRRRSKSPLNRSSPRRCSKTPVRRNSRSPVKKLSRSPVRRARSPIRRRTRSPVRRRSRSPADKQTRFPLKGRSKSPRKLSPQRRRSRSPRKLSPLKRRSRSPRKLSPLRRRSRSPANTQSRGPKKRSRSPRKSSPQGKRGLSSDRKRLSTTQKHDIQSKISPKQRDPPETSTRRTHSVSKSSIPRDPKAVKVAESDKPKGNDAAALQKILNNRRRMQRTKVICEGGLQDPKIMKDQEFVEESGRRNSRLVSERKFNPSIVASSSMHSLKTLSPSKNSTQSDSLEKRNEDTLPDGMMVIDECHNSSDSEDIDGRPLDMDDLDYLDLVLVDDEVEDDNNEVVDDVLSIELYVPPEFHNHDWENGSLISLSSLVCDDSLSSCQEIDDGASSLGCEPRTEEISLDMDLTPHDEQKELTECELDPRMDEQELPMAQDQVHQVEGNNVVRQGLGTEDWEDCEPHNEELDYDYTSPEAGGEDPGLNVETEEVSVLCKTAGAEVEAIKVNDAKAELVAITSPSTPKQDATLADEVEGVVKGLPIQGVVGNKELCDKTAGPQAVSADAIKPKPCATSSGAILPEIDDEKILPKGTVEEIERQLILYSQIPDSSGTASGQSGPTPSSSKMSKVFARLGDRLDDDVSSSKSNQEMVDAFKDEPLFGNLLRRAAKPSHVIMLAPIPRSSKARPSEHNDTALRKTLGFVFKRDQAKARLKLYCSTGAGAPYHYGLVVFNSIKMAKDWYAKYENKETKVAKIVLPLKIQNGVVNETPSYLYFSEENWACQCSLSNFPLRSLCHRCGASMNEGSSPLTPSDKATQWVGIFKLPFDADEKYVLSCIQKTYKNFTCVNMTMITDPALGTHCGICVVELADRSKAGILKKNLSGVFHNVSYVVMNCTTPVRQVTVKRFLPDRSSSSRQELARVSPGPRLPSKRTSPTLKLSPRGRRRDKVRHSRSPRRGSPARLQPFSSLLSPTPLMDIPEHRSPSPLMKRSRNRHGEIPSLLDSHDDLSYESEVRPTASLWDLFGSVGQRSPERSRYDGDRSAERGRYGRVSDRFDDERPRKPDGNQRFSYPPPDSSQFLYERHSKLYYDPDTTLYFDRKSGFYYNDDLKMFLDYNETTGRFTEVLP